VPFDRTFSDTLAACDAALPGDPGITSDDG
jgi:hypothetical protein